MARDRDRRGKSPSTDRRRVFKKKVSVLTSENIRWVDYKDVNLLRRFMSERAKIRSRRVTGNSAQQQRAVAHAIRIAREMALLPYAVRQVTQRNKGGRGRDRDMPRAVPDAPPPTAVPGDGDGEGVLDADELAPEFELAETENGDGELEVPAIDEEIVEAEE
jgi:small subunit ribosomal protein S18